MTLYDFIAKEQADFDTFDTEYDVCVTVCEPYEYDEGKEKEPYDVFTELIMKNVEVESKTGECTCVCKWSDFINRNIDTFKRAAEQLWYALPKTDDTLVYEWIKEIHYWLAGCVSNKTYDKFIKEYGNLLK